MADVDPPGTAASITPPPRHQQIKPTIKELTSQLGQRKRHISLLQQQVTAKDEEIAALRSKMSKFKEELDQSNKGKWAEKKATNNLLAAADDRTRVAMDRAAEPGVGARLVRKLRDGGDQQ